MLIEWTYAIGSVLLISLLAFIGLFTLSINKKTLNRMLIYLVSFAAGALIGDAFIHLLPEIVKTVGFTLSISLWILFGIVSMFILEKFVHWHHCHYHIHKHSKIEPFVIMNLVGDGVHNFIDGLIIGASYLISIPVGIATTIAVALHEIPQEIGDFSILLHGGFSRGKALFFNFLSALAAVFGAIVALTASLYLAGIEQILVPIAVGHFIYIAAADLIPELHKETNLKKSLMQLLWFVLGIAVMVVLVLY